MAGLFDRLRRLAEPRQADPPPCGSCADADAAFAAVRTELALTNRTAELNAARAQALQAANARLTAELRTADLALTIARAEADALHARLGQTGDAALAHAHQTLLDYEDQLATCRKLHGGNSRSAGQTTHLGALA